VKLASKPRVIAGESKPKKTLHLVEFGGRGGVYQHSVAIAQKMIQRGVLVVFHTATDPEFELPDLPLCKCVNWHRNAGKFRKLKILQSYLAHTLPHLLESSRKCTVWVQGMFKPPLVLVTILFIRLLRRRVLFSPHALFVRGGNNLGEILLAASLRASTRVVVYNSLDAKQLRLRKVPTLITPLLQHIPEGFESTSIFRSSLALSDKKIIGSIGQIREDKNLEMTVRIADALGAQALIAGEDLGGVTKVQEAMAASASGHLLITDFLEIHDFVYLVSKLDLLVLPYHVASQSGVASIAKSLGVPIISSEAGALGEEATATVPNGSSVGIWAEKSKLAMNQRPHHAVTDSALDDLFSVVLGLPE
jgi:glycosyltransferase involved in cell wall biosynthesis